MSPATTAVYTLPISAALIILGTCRGGLSLLGVPPGDGIPTTSKHSEKTIVAQLNSEPSLLASTSDCQSQITQAKQVNAYIREVERAVSFMAEKVL